MLPAGKRGKLMREAAEADGAAGSNSRTLVQARIEEWDEQHPFPAARVRTEFPKHLIAQRLHLLLGNRGMPTPTFMPYTTSSAVEASAWPRFAPGMPAQLLGHVRQVDGIIGPTGDLQCETQALLASESAPVSSDFPDKVPTFCLRVVWFEGVICALVHPRHGDANIANSCCSMAAGAGGAACSRVGPGRCRLVGAPRPEGRPRVLH
jgi:hypothetical protein